MYDNVIVPFDGGLELRAALAPAADLAWRCDARVVVVNTTAAADEQSRLVLKSQAISMSGADVDFWVDLDSELGDALVAAAAHRRNPILCVASRYRSTGFLGRKRSVVPAPPQVFTDTPVPVLAVGPETEVSRGLNVTEVVVLDDGAATAAAARQLAVQWAIRLKVALHVVGVVAPSADGPASPVGRTVEDHQRAFAEVATAVPQASLEIVEASDPAAAFCALLDGRPDAVGFLATRGDEIDGRPLGPVAAAVLARSPRALVFAKPDR
jgi:hypothetical protein